MYVDIDKYWELVEEKEKYKKLYEQLIEELKALRHNYQGQKRAAVKYSDKVKELLKEDKDER